MRAGLLWYDADCKKAVSEKIDDAVVRYQEKFGAAPTACHVNPDCLQAHPRLRVVANRLIQPNHYWVGEDDEENVS